MIDDESVTLSRRRVLAGVGAIGVSSIGAGLGTSAYFSDEELFVNNTLTAGSLDLKIDWQEHYSDWSTDEVDAVENEIFMENPEDADYVGLPTADDPVLWVHTDDVNAFMDATAIEAYPDVDDGGGGDGIQDPFAPEPGETTGDGIGYVCDDGADTPDDLDPTAGLRTENEDTLMDTPDGEGQIPAPLVNLDDVKPGDFGELTLGFHLCDNPGYLWMTGELLANAENGVTEPEATDPDEDDGTGVADPDAGDETSGELADTIEAAVWYDSGTDGEWDGSFGGDDEEGDNIRQLEEVEEGEPVHERLIAKGSLAAVLSVLDVEQGFPLNAKLDSPPDGELEPREDLDPTAIVSGDAEASDQLQCATVGGNPHCVDFGLLNARKIDPPEEGTNTYTTNFGGEVTVTYDSSEDESVAEISTDFPVSAVIMKGGPNARVCLADGDADSVALEEGDGVELDGVTFRTPISPNNDQNYGLSHIQICYTPEDDSPPADGDGERECFEASTTHHIGFAWWLPVDHANEIQTDSVAFDLGFYTEQCRHNDGSGMLPENETTPTAE